MRVLTFLLILLISQSCIGFLIRKATEKKLTVERKTIPAEFGSTKSTLICILNETKGYDRQVTKHFKKNYKGDVVFLKDYELKNEKYNDFFKYRYIFTFGFGGSYTDSEGNTHSMRRIYMLDRTDNKKYNSPFSSGFYGKIIKAYSIKLEELRQK